MPTKTAPKKTLDVAYFSMEIMIESEIPSYAGGLGVLAGDLLRSCADMGVNAAAVSIVYSGNTFDQVINPDGTQTFVETDWRRSDHLKKLATQTEITIQNTKVIVDCWRYDFVGLNGHVVPLFLLDTDLPQNPDWVRNLTKNLYRGGGDVRISQELLLGFGGVNMLKALGYEDIKTYHLNEGHCAFVPLALLADHNYQDEEVKKLCTFTTHTPVPEGHDKFNYELAYQFAGDYLPWHIKKLAGEDVLSMTRLALSLSKYSFGVSVKHEKVSQNMFPDFKLHSITNGVYHVNWTSPIMHDLYNKYLPGWMEDPKILKDAVEKLPNPELWSAHMEDKKDLIDYVNRHLTAVSTPEERAHPNPQDQFDPNVLTIALARRPVPYKRPLLLYSDIERLRKIGAGKIQIIQCGKSHPDDQTSQGFVKQIIEISKALRAEIKICYLENYSPKIARLLVRGCDVWLNTPRRPLEASGTSGMKAALNGVLNFSVLDGWWIEGYEMDAESGFTIGPKDDSVTPSNDDSGDSNDLYEKLEKEILPLYYDNREEWITKMKHAIALGSFFNTHRAIEEYSKNAWNS
jgi:starch phosphorylase